MRIVMLADARGRRMGELTRKHPLAMVKIGDQPLLWHALKYLDHLGHRDFVIPLGEGSDAIGQYVRGSLSPAEADPCSLEKSSIQLGDKLCGEQGWQFELIETGEQPATGGCIRQLSSRLVDSPFLLISADRLADVDIPKLERFHREHGRLATVVTVRPDVCLHRMETTGDQVVRCHRAGLSEAFWINGGYFLLEPGALEYIEDNSEAWEEGPLERLAEDGQLMAFRHEGFWQPVETPEDIDRLEQLWASGTAPWKVWDIAPAMAIRSVRTANSKGNILVTGHEGYIGRVVSQRLTDAGYTVTGLDSQLYTVESAAEQATEIAAMRMDIRDVSADDLHGFDAIVHLAGLSDDGLGNVVPETTYDVNYRGTVNLAEAAKAAGVSRLLYAASCGIYDAVSEGWLTEQSRLNPITPYSIAIALAEAELARLADERFSPTCLRLATAYGVSPNFRTDLMINRLVGQAVATGCLTLDDAASEWRPTIHVEDIAVAFLSTLGAPRHRIHNQIFNVGTTSENYRQRDVIRLLQRMLPALCCDGIHEETPTTTDYRVSFEKLRRILPEYKPRWTLARGLRQLIQHYRELRITEESLTAAPQYRQQQLEELLHRGQLAPDLRWKPEVLAYRRVAA